MRNSRIKSFWRPFKNQKCRLIFFASYLFVGLCTHTISRTDKVQQVPTVQITFIFIWQTHLVFGKCVCTCVRKHSNTFRTSLNWLKNLKCIWHEPKKFTFCVCLVSEIVICERLVGPKPLVKSMKHKLVYRDDLSLDRDVRGIKCIYK